MFPTSQVAMMDRAASGGFPSCADTVVEQLREWPAVEIYAIGGELAVRMPGGAVDIARLRQPDEAELRLTRAVIERLSDALAEDGRVRAKPDSDWVQVTLHGTSDVRLVVMLVSLAIREHANQAGSVTPVILR